jgi:5-methyltetrahydropteroyltriglutamate--homocysteine methyltransferase
METWTNKLGKKPMTTTIRTTVIGSYPVPEWLRALPNQVNLRDAAMVVMKAQELAGIDVISDGELSRFDVSHPDTNGMIEYFIRPMSGIDAVLSRDERQAFQNRPGFAFRSQPAGVVRSPLGEGQLDLPRSYNSVKSLTPLPLKFTVTSPYMLAKTLLDSHYGNLEKLVLALADVLKQQVEAIDAPVLQVDEANLPGSPQDGPIAAAGINRVLAGGRGEKGVHLCFGNYGGQTIQKGFFRDLIPFFNSLECDHLLLEFARRGDDELGVFHDLKPGISLGLGVIDIKDNEVESVDLVAERIERAVKALGAERIRWVHPDCGFWMLSRSVADRKLQALAAGRDRFLGRVSR